MPIHTDIHSSTLESRLKSIGESIRTGKSEIIGYRETDSGNREILRDKNGRILGRFETDTGITRAADGKIIGRGLNQMLRLLT